MSDCANHNYLTEEAPVLTAATDTSIRHVYIHIPFCARICPYCAFYKDLLDRSQTEGFCQAILLELGQHMAIRRVQPTTIYFGGGTPTALTIPQLEFLLGGFHEKLDLREITEWSIEANPGSVSARKARLLRNFGINRVSLGVQSWDDNSLKILGREHDAAQAVRSFTLLREAGFSNINIDLMFGLPGQTIQQWETTLKKTVALKPEHISTYCLTYEEDTEFFLRRSRGEFQTDLDAEAELFEMTMCLLGAAGYEHYEISNYARPGHESVHNRAYWRGEDYLGIGPSAFSTIGTKRWQNVCDYREYISRAFQNQSPIGATENLTSEMKRTERIALSLRTRDGIPAHLLQARPGSRRTADEFVALGLIEPSNENFVLTRAGKALADSVAEAFA